MSRLESIANHLFAIALGVAIAALALEYFTS